VTCTVWTLPSTLFDPLAACLTEQGQLVLSASWGLSMLPATRLGASIALQITTVCAPVLVMVPLCHLP